MATTETVAIEEASHGHLRRELRFWEAIAISIGIMAPTAAMALNGVAPAGLVGRAVPLAFLFAAIAIALISYSFVRLTRFFNHAGSAYALAGATLGPRAGFFAGWTLLATYSCFIVMQFGAAKFLHLERREPRWRVVILVLATAAIVYTFYKQVWPKPAYPYDLFPLIIAGWAVLGAAITFAFPALTRRIGRGLSESEGIVGEPT
jgi:amino acid transporter